MLRQDRAPRSGAWEARYLLGMELAMDGHPPEAQAEFEAAYTRDPITVLSG